MTQKALADRTGVSLRMIGAIEAGDTSASTATLDRLGLAFDATLADLVADPARSRGRVIDRLGWQGPEGGEGTLRWSVDVRREVETWEWRLEPGERYQAAADPQGWSVMVFVVEGRLTLETEADIVTVERDGYLLDSNQVHAFVNQSEEPVRFFRCTAF